MSSLKVDIDGQKAVLSGYLDENSDLSGLKALNGDVTVNFKDVSRVNSCGVKEWVDMITASEAKFTYEDCTLVVVKQLNAVPDFMGQAKVDSFVAPYFCEECDEEYVEMLDANNFDPENPPEVKCSECGDAMTFDGVANQYFQFLKRAA